MTPISAKFSRLFETAPYVLIPAICFYSFWERGPSVVSGAVVGAVMSVALSLVYRIVRRRQSAHLATEVLFDGRNLKVRYGDDSDLISISNIQAIEAEQIRGFGEVDIVLRAPSKFGTRISFYPLRGKNESGENKVVSMLRSTLTGAGRVA
jgi:hypothetical protein